MRKLTGKCKECGSRHSNCGGGDVLNDTCFNCEILLKSFWSCIMGLNSHKPINGKPRKIAILDYEISIDEE